MDGGRAAAPCTGRPWRWPVRAILDGILYVLRTGCAWRHLPLDFPPWSTVYRWFLRLSQAGVFERLAHALTMGDRERVGREASPTGCVVDAHACRSEATEVAFASHRGCVKTRMFCKAVEQTSPQQPRGISKATGQWQQEARQVGFTLLRENIVLQRPTAFDF